MAILGGLGMIAFWFGVLALYLTAFVTGADVWFGWDGWWVPFVAIAAFTFTGSLGTIFVAIVGGYGAYYVWDWHLLAVIVVFFPGLAFFAGAAAFAMVGSLFDRARS